jgi:hypothetical protein
MIYLKVQENEYPAYISGRLIDRDWDGRASKSILINKPTGVKELL